VIARRRTAPQVRAVSKEMGQGIGRGQIPRPPRNGAPRCKVKRRDSVRRQVRGQLIPSRITGRGSAWTAKLGASRPCSNSVWAIRTRRTCSVGQAPRWPRPFKTGALQTGFGASRRSMDSRAWNPAGPGLYLAVRDLLSLPDPIFAWLDMFQSSVRPNTPSMRGRSCSALRRPSTSGTVRSLVAYEGRPVAYGFGHLSRTRPSPLILRYRVLASFPGPTPPLLLARSATGSLGCSAILPGTRTRRDAVNAPTWGPITVMSFRSGRLAEFRLLARTGLAPDQFRRSEGTQTLPAGALGQRGSNTSKRGNRRGSISTGRSSVSDWGRGLGASGRRVSE
jgi:hypothetical protein